MKLQGLRALLAIVEYGTFSEAALELGTSQSAVSHAIAELEAELGVRLLDRGRFGAVPTEVGGRVIGHARTVESILDAIRQEAALATGCLSGTLRVSSFRSAATRVLAPAIARLGVLHPGLRVNVHEVPSRHSEVTDTLHAGTVDVALTMSFLAEDAVFWELLRDSYIAVVPQEFGSSGDSVSIERLMSNPVILSDGPCSYPVRDVLLLRDPDFRPAFEISEDSTILSLVGQGLGVALMPELTVDVLPPGVRCLALEESVERRVGVAFLPGALKIPSVRAFLGVLRALHPDGEVPQLAASVAAPA